VRVERLRHRLVRAVSDRLLTGPRRIAMPIPADADQAVCRLAERSTVMV